MGRRNGSEVTAVKALMEITGQNRDDVQNVLREFGGDEDLACAELMKSKRRLVESPFL